MSVSVSQVRSSIAQNISDLSGFREVRMLPEYFGRSQNTLGHLGFSVEMSATNGANERQRRSVGCYVESLVRVRFAYRIRPHDVVLDYGNALDKEQEVIGAVMARDFNRAIEIRFVRSSRRAPDSQEYIISEMEFSALHTFTLT